MSQTLVLERGRDEFRVTVSSEGHVRVGDRDVAVTPYPDGSLRFPALPGAAAWAVSSGETRWVFLDGQVYELDVRRGAAGGRRGDRHHGSLSAPMPATVRRINVSAGDRVERGDALIVLEAMKMELPVKATAAGTVTAVHCREGELVQPGSALIALEEDA